MRAADPGKIPTVAPALAGNSPGHRSVLRTSRSALCFVVADPEVRSFEPLFDSVHAAERQATFGAAAKPPTLRRRSRSPS